MPKNVTSYIFFLGHQPHLSLAELESVFGEDSIKEIQASYAILDLEDEPNIDRLGGTTKISEITKTTKIDQNPEKQILDLISEQIIEQKT
ncbi:MAG: hypothetical protein QG623_470, partial [Patescibacteria group bacterium]|nr:hypothetical protein [Patescibacteria group bacterium]